MHIPGADATPKTSILICNAGVAFMTRTQRSKVIPPPQNAVLLTCADGQGESIPACCHGDALQLGQQVGHPAAPAGTTAQLPMLIAAKGEASACLWWGGGGEVHH